MSVLIDYAESSFVESDETAQIRFEAPSARSRFVKTVDTNGVIHLVPWDRLDEAEKVILENRQLYTETIEGLRAFERGEGVSSDWLLADDDE